jgi:hypothetical protein
MRRRIRDLDFDAIVAQIASATDRVRRIGCTAALQDALRFVHSSSDAVAMLRDHVTLAALEHTKTLDDIRFDQPLVQALVRIQHHRLARPIPTAKVQRGLRGPDAGPRLSEITSSHPELTWDTDAVQRLIILAIRNQHGDHELDDAEPPWDMYWSPASSAADALVSLVTLRALGDL